MQACASMLCCQAVYSKNHAEGQSPQMEIYLFAMRFACPPQLMLWLVSMCTCDALGDSQHVSPLLSAVCPPFCVLHTTCCCVCRHGSPSAYQELEPLLKALEVPSLSRAVQQSVVPVPGWSGSVELDPIIADCLLALQRYLVHHMPALYQAQQDTITPRLLNLR